MSRVQIPLVAPPSPCSSLIPLPPSVSAPEPSSGEDASMQLSVEGRAALITGGSKGLGLAMGRAFAGAGGKVALVARGAEALAAAEAELKAAAPDAQVVGIR